VAVDSVAALQSLSERAFQRLGQLALVSDEPGILTREFFGPGMILATELVQEWMRNAGLHVERDGWGNLFGRTAPPTDSRPLLVLGSHLDTVRNAGKFDGSLGVLAALAAVESLDSDARARLPFVVEVSAFSDEEGVRFHTTYLGSRAAVGAIRDEDLQCCDRTGTRLADLIDPSCHHPVARYRPGQLLGYLEAHIEQGPVLEQEGLPVGVVQGIAGQTRVAIGFTGMAAHAGTCPMGLRKDALAGAAELVLAVEKLARNTSGLVATVGCLEVPDAASNVVPGCAKLSLDLRHLEDSVRQRTLQELSQQAEHIAQERGLRLEWRLVQEAPSVPCDRSLQQILSECVERNLGRAISLRGGAGHDAVAMAQVGPIGMLFVRCAGGVSHHPSESIDPADLSVAIQVLADAILALGEKTS